MELNYEKTLLTVNEAALLTGINPSTIKNWIHCGKLNAKKELIDGRHTLLLDRNEVIEHSKTFKGKIHTKDEIEQMICAKKEHTQIVWERYHQFGPTTDKKWNVDKPMSGMNERKERALERSKKYQSENKEKISERNKKYYSENKEKISDYYKRYRSDNKEKISDYYKRYRSDNNEKIKECQQRYYSENKERIKEQRKKRYVEKKRKEETK